MCADWKKYRKRKYRTFTTVEYCCRMQYDLITVAGGLSERWGGHSCDKQVTDHCSIVKCRMPIVNVKESWKVILDHGIRRRYGQHGSCRVQADRISASVTAPKLPLKWLSVRFRFRPSFRYGRKWNMVSACCRTVALSGSTLKRLRLCNYLSVRHWPYTEHVAADISLLSKPL